MSFQKKCGCVSHSENTSELSSSDVFLKDLTKRPFKNDLVKDLIENDLLPKRARYLCTGCAAHFSARSEGHTEVEPGTSGCKKPRCSDLQIVVNSIRNGMYDESELVTLAEVLGLSQQTVFRSHVDNNFTFYKEQLNDFNIASSLQNKNQVLLSFLKGITGFNESFKAKISLLAAVDCLMSVCNSHLVTPLLFALNLSAYFISGSKSISELLSAVMPAGSYYCVRTWFQELGCQKIQCPDPRHDLINFFDNSQILSRNWRVRYNSKLNVSVITSVVHIHPTVSSNLQFDADLDPQKWLYSSTDNHGVEAVSETIYSLGKKFGKYRDDFISEILQCVLHENEAGNILCDENLNKDITSKDPYSFLPHFHDSRTNISVGEPCLKNPCSSDAVKTVLENLLTNVNVPENRKWCIIGCDGLPFILSDRLIKQHEHLQHILLQPGLGHYEINMTKSLFKLLWEVCLSEIAKMLGYTSLWAQTCCSKATDHHKSWQILNIFLFGTAKELLFTYIQTCNDNNPSIQNYYSWLQEVKNPNYKFMVEVIFTYMFGLYLFRSAVRRNNSEAMMIARTKTSALFYGLNQINYQLIDYLDLRTRCLSPPMVKEFLERNESFSVSGDASKGEGGDFVLEAVNRRLKMLMPPGLATEKRWLNVCRSYDTIDKIRSHLNDSLDINEKDPHYTYHPNLEREIMEWRKKIRNTDYFSSPVSERPHISITGQPLDQDLVDFSNHCKGNRQLYLEDIMKGSRPGKGIKLTPIFIRKADRDKFRSINNKTKKDIETLILREIGQVQELGFDEEAEELRNTWAKKVKGKTKDVYITFYCSDVVSVLDECVNNHSELGEEEFDE